MTGVVGGLVAVAVLGYVVRQVVRGHIRVRYAAVWLLVSAAVALVALIPHLLDGLSGLLGFAVPANMLFFSGITFLLLVGISLSAAVTRLEDRVQRLAEEVSLLAEVRDDRGPGPGGSDRTTPPPSRVGRPASREPGVTLDGKP